MANLPSLWGVRSNEARRHPSSPVSYMKSVSPRNMSSPPSGDMYVLIFKCLPGIAQYANCNDGDWADEILSFAELNHVVFSQLESSKT